MVKIKWSKGPDEWYCSYGKCCKCNTEFMCSKAYYCPGCGEKIEDTTYGDIYEEFCKKFPYIEVEDYRPAVTMHVPWLLKGIPNAIVVWLKDGSELIYIAESEGCNNDEN